MSPENVERVHSIVYRLEALQDIETLKQMLKMHPSKEIEKAVANFFFRGLYSNFKRSFKGSTHPSKSKNDSGQSFLGFAIYSKDKELARLLLESGADLTKTGNPGRLFKQILEFGDLEMVKLAYQQGGNFKRTSKEAESPLQFIASKLPEGYDENIFKWMVEQGADLNSYEPDHQTPFGTVILSGNASLVEYCLEQGAELYAKDQESFSPMESAAFYQTTQKLQFFKDLSK